jgi:uncharacterized protein YuzE
MKTRYDSNADALYLGFSDEPIVESEEVRPGIIFDLDSEGRVIGIEILDAAQHMARGTDLKSLATAA